MGLFFVDSRYAKEIDIEFSTKSVRAIGQTTYHVPSCVTKATQILMDLVHTRVDHIVQECVIVIKVRQAKIESVL